MDKAKLIFDSYAVSDKGRVRQLNEDRYLVAPRSGIWLVADGMGGHEAGEVASTAIVDHLATLGVASSAPDLRARFEDRIARANAEIWRIAQERGGTMGSTVAALLTFDGQFACIWLGDSRVYLVRDGRLSQISRDHTEVQELVDRGILTPAEARTWPRRNVITKAVGATEEIATDIELGHTRPGDIFVLGSDGLTAHVSDDEILQVSVDRDPESTCNTLLQMVLERGGTDNVTIIVVRCREEMPEELYERTFIQSGSAEA